MMLSLILQKLGLNAQQKIIALPKRESKWIRYSGWAAAIILAVGLLWLLSLNNQMRLELELAKLEQKAMEEQIAKANDDIGQKDQLLAVLRNKAILSIPLAGQAIAPEAYAKVYWDKSANNIYLDVQGLPTPPDGMVYQVWSLTLNPLTPTNLGVLDQFSTDENKIFTISNPNNSEAFGITLEPAGGSASPTLEQLYTLGVVES